MNTAVLLTIPILSTLHSPSSAVLHFAALAGTWRLAPSLRLAAAGIAVCAQSMWLVNWQEDCVLGVAVGLEGDVGVVWGMGLLVFLSLIQTTERVLLAVTFCVFIGLYLSYLDRRIRLVTALTQAVGQEVTSLKRHRETLKAQIHLDKFQQKPLTGTRTSKLLTKLTDLSRPSLGQSADVTAIPFISEESPALSDTALSLPMESEESIDASKLELTNDDLDFLVNSVLSRESGKWSEQQLKMISDLFAERLDLRDALSQKLEETVGSSQRVFRPAPQQKITIKEIQGGSSELSELLGTLGDWNFDTLSIVEYTKEPLKEVGFSMFQAYSLVEEFEIPREKLLGFLTRVEAKYLKSNFYHNSVHAADVLNSAIHLLMSSLNSLGSFLSVEVFALLVAAIGHDVSHPGFNNSFLIATQDPLALRYNDRSVLEMMHCSLVFQVLERPDSAITASLTQPTFMAFRKVVITLILATDLQKHMSKVRELQKYVEDDEKTLMDASSRVQVLELCIICADLGHGAKSLSLHQKWSNLILQEFFQQGDRERQLGLPVSPICDKETAKLPQVQLGFLTLLVIPVFELWTQLIRKEVQENEAEASRYAAQGKENVKYWKEEMERDEQGKGQFQLHIGLPPLLSK